MQDKDSIDSVVKRHLSLRSKLIFRRIRKYFLTGILVAAPITLTIYLTYALLAFIDSGVARILPGPFEDSAGNHHIIPGLGLVIAVSVIIGIGWFASNFLGQFCFRCSEYVMEQVPIMRTIYNSIKQIIETLLGSQAKAFREVVLLEYPREGTWTLGFVTGKPEGEINDNIKGNEVVNVFVPTAPSPVNGFLLFVPRKDLIPLKMTVEEGIKMVVSVGIIAPAVPQEKVDKAA